MCRDPIVRRQTETGGRRMGTALQAQDDRIVLETLSAWEQQQTNLAPKRTFKGSKMANDCQICVRAGLGARAYA